MKRDFLFLLFLNSYFIGFNSIQYYNHIFNVFRKYDNFYEGEFILYRHKTLPYEVSSILISWVLSFFSKDCAATITWLSSICKASYVLTVVLLFVCRFTHFTVAAPIASTEMPRVIVLLLSELGMMSLWLTGGFCMYNHCYMDCKSHEIDQICYKCNWC